LTGLRLIWEKNQHVEAAGTGSGKKLKVES